MTGWKSTKDGKHFKTGTKPGINSNHNNHSNNSGSQSSSIRPSTHNRPASTSRPIATPAGVHSSAMQERIKEHENMAKEHFLQDMDMHGNFYRRDDGKIEREWIEYNDIPRDKAIHGEQFDPAVIVSEKDFLDYMYDDIVSDADTMLGNDYEDHEYNAGVILSSHKPSDGKLEFVFETSKDYAMTIKAHNAKEAYSIIKKEQSDSPLKFTQQYGNLTKQYNINTDDHEAPVGSYPFAV